MPAKHSITTKFSYTMVNPLICLSSMVQVIIQYDSNCISRDHEGLHIFTPRNQPKRKLELPSKRNGCIGWVHVSPEMF